MSESLEWKYVPPSYEIADSLMKLAQDIEIGKGRVSVATPPFLREAADRIQRQQDAIERLREALKEIAEPRRGHEWRMRIALEALNNS